MTDRQRLLTGRVFVIVVVALSWWLSIQLQAVRPIFGLAVWCFSGFAALFPLVFAALYWRRVTKWGAYASVVAGIGLGVYYYVTAGLKTNFSGRGEPLVHIPIGGYDFELVPAAPMVLAATLALIVVSLMTRPPRCETVEKFVGGRRHAS
jgi:SSS family solute:Na+ symporter